METVWQAPCARC